MRSKTDIKQGDTRKEILLKTTPMLAEYGYSGVSMRDISKAVGISSAALYHHFADKKELYLEVMKLVFSDKAIAMTATLEIKGTPLERMEHFITSFVILIDADPNFRILVQRELLDGDKTRLKLLAEDVFYAPFQAIITLAEELDIDCDPHMLAVSIIGLVMFHFETAPILKFLPGSLPEHNSPEKITKHVMTFITKAFSPAEKI